MNYLPSDDGEKAPHEIVQSWLDTNPNRYQMSYFCWRMTLRKFSYIDNEIGEWLGPKEIVLRRYFFPVLRSVIIARQLALLGQNSGRITSIGLEATEYIDEADYEEGAVGTVILCRLAQLSLFGSWADGVDFKKITKDVFKHSSAIDLEEDSYYLEALNDISNLQLGSVGGETLFASSSRYREFNRRLSIISSWANEYDESLSVWFEWIQSICQNNRSFMFSDHLARMFDFSLATKSADWWKRCPKEVSADIIELKASLQSNSGAYVAKNIPRWASKYTAMVQVKEYDYFISHSSEDKDDIARPLASALESLGFRVWFDERSITIGDSLRGAIDNGLAKSRYGIVIISHAFFAKPWPKFELDGLFSKEVAGAAPLLPVWHKIEFEEVCVHSPMLAGRLAISTEKQSVQNIAKLISKSYQN